MNLDKIFKQIKWFLTSFNTLNNLPDAVLIVNKDGIIDSFNKQAKEIFGFIDNSFGKYNISNIIKDSKAIVTKSANLSQPVLATASMADREFYIEINAKPCFRGYSLTVRDLSTFTKELKNDEKTIKFNNEKNAMLAKLEDDIKAPISSIAGFSKGLLDGLGGDLSEKQAKYVNIIHNNAIELNEFMEKLLTFSKVESSIYEGNYRTFDGIELIKNSSKEFIQELENRGIDFDIDGTLLKNRNIYTDANAFQEAYINILQVAANMTEKGSISVVLSTPTEEVCGQLPISDPEKYLHLEITDTGTGIPAEDMKYLCEPYAQLEKSKKHLLRAFRLGIASILIKRMDGNITIKSEVKKGTRYEIILPVEKR